MRMALRLLSTLFVLGLVACSSGQHSDLYEYMDEVRKRPRGDIEPLPVFRAYQNFNYSAVAMRSPFDAPIIIGEKQQAIGKSTIKPDDNRRKEYLENYNFAALSLVGSLSRDDQQWALIDDGEGGIHRVKVGNYLGKNHGRIVNLTPIKLDIIEIVPDGKGGWLERPRSLALKEKE